MAILAAYAVPHPPLIIPGVGRGRERGIQATIDAYEEVGRRIAALAPETLVISTPHSVMYLDYNHISPGRHAEGSFAEFGDPRDRYEVDYDVDFVRSLEAAAGAYGLAAGTMGERDPSLDHATMIPLHFVRAHWGEAGTASEGRPFPRVVRIGLSGLSPAVHYQLGMAVQRTASVLGRRVVYIASGDLSHKLAQDGPYGFAPEGPVFDERIGEIFRSGDLLGLLTMDHSLAERAAECGLRSFQIMAGALDRTPVTSELLSLEGPFGVGYGVGCFTPTGPEGSDYTRDFLSRYEEWHTADLAARKAEEDPLVRLARRSLETYVRTGLPLQLGDPDEELAAILAQIPDERAGCFVSLKKDGELRGCIGTILPTSPGLTDEIVGNAISAGTRDPRFSPVTEDELPELVYDVDVLTAPEPIDGPDQLDVRRYGVIVSTEDGRRGLLLPDLDGVDTVDEQIRIATRKGHIGPDEEVSLQRFEVVRHV